MHLPFLCLVYGLCAVLLTTPKGIRSPVQTLGCSLSCTKSVACKKPSRLQYLITLENYSGSMCKENTDTTHIHVKNTSVGIIALYLSSLISLKGVGNIHYNGEHCTTVLVKEVSSLPQLLNGSCVCFFLYYQIFII